MTDQAFWLGRWERGEIGWHRDQPHPRMVEFFSGKPPLRVCVPLCGKSLDLVWLHDQGHEVIGVELSEKACREFFAERGLTPEIRECDGFRVFEHGRYRLIQGDFMSLPQKLKTPIDRVYDRAALIALNPEQRKQYGLKLQEWLHEGGAKSPEILSILLERAPHDENGPPHSVLPQELKDLFQQKFSRIEEIARDEMPELSPSGAKVIERVFHLSGWR